MRKKIFKYPFHTPESRSFWIPKGGKILHFGLQADLPTIWVEVEPDAETVLRNFIIYGTGRLFEAVGLTYIGTVVGHLGQYVWHLYEEGAP